MQVLHSFGVSLIVPLLVSSLGCSTAYMPKRSPRVQIIQQSGVPAFVRDGHVYSGGLFGGEIEEAVRGNPEAEEHARAFQNGMLGGFMSSILGGAALIGGLTLVAADSQNQAAGDGNATREIAAGGLLIGGGVAYVTGLILMFNAQPHLWDAINVYNDGLLAPVPIYAPPPPYGPPFGTPAAPPMVPVPPAAAPVAPTTGPAAEPSQPH